MRITARTAASSAAASNASRSAAAISPSIALRASGRASATVSTPSCSERVTIGPDGTVRRRVIVGYEHFLRLARRVQWDEAEIDLGPDARAWPEAGDDVAAELLAGFCVGEAGVAEQLAPFAAAAEPLVAECFAAQERDERRHARFFARAWDAMVGGDPRERAEARVPRSCSTCGCRRRRRAPRTRSPAPSGSTT